MGQVIVSYSSTNRHCDFRGSVNETESEINPSGCASVQKPEDHLFAHLFVLVSCRWNDVETSKTRSGLICIPHQ